MKGMFKINKRKSNCSYSCKNKNSKDNKLKMRKSINNRKIKSSANNKKMK